VYDNIGWNLDNEETIKQ